MTAVALFNPIKLEKGELRVCLNLTALGERAWHALAYIPQVVHFPESASS
jgi:hypothetical protein